MVLNASVGEIPASGDAEFWEPKALELLALLEQRGPLSLRAIKSAMTRSGQKVGLTLNVLAYLSITGRADYCREKKQWYALKS